MYSKMMSHLQVGNRLTTISHNSLKNYNTKGLKSGTKTAIKYKWNKKKQPHRISSRNCAVDSFLFFLSLSTHWPYTDNYTTGADILIQVSTPSSSSSSSPSPLRSDCYFVYLHFSPSSFRLILLLDSMRFDKFISWYLHI